MNVREIIKESTVRVNLVPRRQAVPGDIMETAFRLLKGIVAKYNSDNLLNFTRNSVLVKNSQITHIYDETDFVKGKNNMYFETAASLHNYQPSSEDYENEVWAMAKDSPNTVFIVYSPAVDVYDWRAQVIQDHNLPRIQQMEEYMSMNHVCVRDVAKVNSVYLVTPSGTQFEMFRELEFVPNDKFDSYIPGSLVYTVIEKSEGEWLVKVKPVVAGLNARIKINYNEAIEFDIDSDLFIPDNYTELLIVALAHKLALQYPRLDDAQMTRLENEVRILVDNVRTPKSMTRMVLRNDYDYFDDRKMTQAELMGGLWF